MVSSLRLRSLRLEDEAAARAAHVQMLAEGFTFLLGEYDPVEPWGGFLTRLGRERAGCGLRPDRVPATFLVAEVDGVLVGRVSIRHELNEYLARFGGHVGYAVLPGFRRRGYATEILAQSLNVARQVGLDRVLLTCDDDNIGSAAVIERCGGVLDDIIDGPPGGGPTRRYWLTTPP